MGISERITSIRKAKGITQTFIAERLEMDRGNYSKLEKRGEKMTVEQLQSIADALEVSVVDLLGLNDKPGTGGSEARMLELEDRIRDKDYRAKALERERIILEDLIFNSLSEGVNHTDDLKAYDSFIRNNPWLVSFLTGLSFNSLNVKNQTWKRFWRKAIDEFVKRYFKTINEDEQRPGYELVLAETFFSIDSPQPVDGSIDDFLEWSNNPDNDVETISFYSYLGSLDDNKEK